jgi:hypothetical protein
MDGQLQPMSQVIHENQGFALMAITKEMIPAHLGPHFPKNKERNNFCSGLIRTGQLIARVLLVVRFGFEFSDRELKFQA